ncbi:MAG: hypothetical protein ACRDT0_05640 [Pseudonocardiaceae bacterium]
MDPVASAQPGAGVFRRLLHHVEADAPSIIYQGVRVWFAPCGAVCLPAPGGLVTGLPVCPDCASQAPSPTPQDRPAAHDA